MNKLIVVEEIAKEFVGRVRFSSLGNALYVAEAIYDKLEMIGALKPNNLPRVVEVKGQEGIERLREAVIEVQNKRLADAQG